MEAICVDNLTVRRLKVDELMGLTKLFDYRDVDGMFADNTRRMENREIEIFCLFKGERLVGELHAMYVNEDERMAIRGVRAYLFAFRVHEDVQGKGYGKYLLNEVIDLLAEKGYREFTVGVEDDNARAIHIYKTFGFDELVARKQEEYQGYSYEYNLYLKRG
ncbi:MAG: GNAT family N-acetyltransferase [Lachnospiraceae bacterium]|nr:GNAT family N-acetyltransferase [Lachnospiraceae bacterium]